MWWLRLIWILKEEPANIYKPLNLYLYSFVQLKKLNITGVKKIYGKLLMINNA